MFFDEVSKIGILAQKTGFSIFSLPQASLRGDDFATISAKFPKSQSATISPDDNNKISVATIREIAELCRVKQTNDFFIVIPEADTLNEAAQNAFLKLLEEPAENYHFVFFVKDLSMLLPTVLSRGDIYVLRVKDSLSAPVASNEAVKNYARQIISAKSSDLSALYTKISADKNFKKNSRTFMLAIVDTAVEILYKSYFKTKNPSFMKKLPALIRLQENLKQNGHIKLHFVADLC